MRYKISFGEYMQRDEKTDTWDVEEAITRFSKEAHAYAELYEKNSGLLEKEFEEQYKEVPDATLHTDSLVSLVLSKIGFTLETHQALKERAMEIIQDPKGRYYVRHGRGNGGRGRMNDEQYAIFLESGKNPSDIEQEAKAAKAAAKKAAK
jgi:hypothetical protein